MLNKFKKFFKDKNKKRLIENIFSLGILQTANYLLPLITLPYLVRVLGTEKFGIIIFAQAFVAYFGILVNYGFDLSATREISINRENSKKVSEIFNSVFGVKLLLVLISFILISIIIFSFEKFREEWFIYYFTFGTVLGSALFPVWFFQGMEQMRYITFLNITAKLIFTISIFVFIHESSDYVYVPIINSFGYITAGIFALYIVLKNFSIKFTIPNFEQIKYQLKEGWHIFLVSLQTNILSSSGIFILGLFQPKEIVGVYGAIEKISRAVIMLFSPVRQALYPHISAKLKKSKIEGINFIKKVGFLVSVLVFFVCLILAIFSGNIINILFGEELVKYAIILQILSIYIFLSNLNNFIGVQYLLGLGHNEIYSKAFTLASVFSLILYFSLTPFYSFYGIIFGMLIGELVLSFYMFFLIKKYSL